MHSESTRSRSVIVQERLRERETGRERGRERGTEIERDREIEGER